MIVNRLWILGVIYLSKYLILNTINNNKDINVMANPQTAAEWKQVAAEYQAKLDKSLAEQAVAKADLEQARIAKAEARAALDASTAATGAGSPETKELRSKYNAANRVELNLNREVTQNAQIIASERESVNNANTQAATAQTGPPNTSMNTPPANPDPGNNTAVTTTPAPLVQNDTPAATDAETGAVATPQITETPNNQSSIDDGSDPYVSNGQTTIPRADNNTTVDDGSDPYVSNGQTTIPTANNNTTIDDGSDPYVSNGESTIPRAYALEQVTVRANSQSPFEPAKDWRFRISLAPKADYLYKVGPGEAGILNPLQSTNGVIFPYSPTISVSYNANYDTTEPTHSNYKIHNYKNSSVDNITIGGDFTAQDSSEANYMLAVIHFFRSVTKMFYGQDQNPARGVPPPLCYLTGFGQYQFNYHPVVITNFVYSLPTDVDYINAYPTGKGPVGVNLTPYEKPYNSYSTPTQRLLKSGLKPGGTAPRPVFTNNININEVTRVPTKISIQLQCLPIVTRNAISNEFSLNEYATGGLLLGSKSPNTGGGIW